MFKFRDANALGISPCTGCVGQSLLKSRPSRGHSRLFTTPPCSYPFWERSKRESHHSPLVFVQVGFFFRTFNANDTCRLAKIKLMRRLFLSFQKHTNGSLFILHLPLLDVLVQNKKIMSNFMYESNQFLILFPYFPNCTHTITSKGKKKNNKKIEPR